MLSYEDSLKILKETKALISGHFILSSGLHSSEYIQCAKLLSYPLKAEVICSSLCDKIKNTLSDIDLILSPAIGGIVVGYEIGRQLTKETIFAERENGNLTLRRNFEILSKKNVLIVEDVITTGKSALECYKLIEDSKANVLGYACIINRSTNKSLKDKPIISQLELNIKTFDKNNIPKNLKEIKAIKPGSRNLNKWKKEDSVLTLTMLQP